MITESHLSCAVMDADFVFEAIVEDLLIKNSVLKSWVIYMTKTYDSTKVMFEYFCGVNLL